MLRDLRIFRRNSNTGKAPASEINNENLPVDPSGSSTSQLESDPSRAPLITIQEPVQNPNPGLDQGAISRRKPETTHFRSQVKGSDSSRLPFHTPEKMVSRQRFGWGLKGEPGMNDADNGDDLCYEGPSSQLPPLSRGGSICPGGGFGLITPRMYRTAAKASSVHSDCSSTQSTPTKSVTKPPSSGFSNSRPPVSARTRTMSIGTPRTTPSFATVAHSSEVPHFELKEDPSFWMDHNVQVVIRVRPLSSTEKSLQGLHRCLKQESAHNISWIGQPETRFTFDYVACETINQEMLFRVAGLPMVENCMSGYNSCVFAYGQTGSGKTYTMLGEIGELEVRPSLNRGMTPRIFEFLFARIKAEEESRRDEKLKYSCKCSFLEIYNEQITDLLDPTSSNLLLREDIRKGVYVENLTEYVVENVNDILNLLIQGAANRKVAATNMNRESSRSHSVFTCIIESRWEKDSTVNLRFARLNLVDLAGSERQKTSGAEGERLKEAANINKSLSTLGHVIMVLADVAHGKHRHVPYRDSRLTFLLQDSLGGNSKTMIIANVSPSICSANETLSTLKFAQRARLIQNNAVVNEDASGDVISLRHQIHLLKEELSVLKHQNISRSLSFRNAIFENRTSEVCDEYVVEKLPEVAEANDDEFQTDEGVDSIRVSMKQLKSLEAILVGALRREKMADTTIKQLQAEIEQLNRLVRQREDDTQSTKMMLKFREDKIRRMENLLEGQMPVDSYLMEEKLALSEEVQLLRARVDKNPEVTRFALENIRLLDQLRRFQDFYKEGERELLLAEVIELRNKVSAILELDILKTILAEEKSSFVEVEERANHTKNELKSANGRILYMSKQYEDINNELKDARSIIEALESEHILLINEMEEARERCNQQKEILNKQEQEIFLLRNKSGLCPSEIEKQSTVQEELRNIPHGNYENEGSPLQVKLKKMQASLEKARDLNMRCQSDQVSQTSLEQEMDEVRRQVEIETAEVIVCLQEELAALQKQADGSKQNELIAKQNLIGLQTELKELHVRLHVMAEENEKLGELIEEKDRDLRSLTEDWERLACEIADILADGNMSLEEATDQVDSISDSFPKRSWIGEQIERIIKGISERDLLIEELQKCLEEAQNIRCDMEWKLRSLRGATLAITEAQQLESSDKEQEILRLTTEITEKMFTINELENGIEVQEEQIKKAELNATVAFMTVNKLSEMNEAHLREIAHVSDAKAIAAHKTIEATHLLANIEEAQGTMQDADIMVNMLLQANETAKCDIERLQNTETMLCYEKNLLIDEVQHLQSSLHTKEKEYTSLEKNFESNLIEARGLVLELEDSCRNLQTAFAEKFESLACDLDWIKSNLQDYTESIRSCLEKTWSEIIRKDCALSVLHLCHMGILIERITGLNMENGFLQRGLCKSNTLIADLSERNFIDEIDFLENSIRSLLSENSSLRSDLIHKDEVAKGILFDLRLLQESASIAKDQEDELKQMVATMESLEDELASRSCELDEAIVLGKTLEGELIEKNDKILALELELAEKLATINSISVENFELKSHLQQVSAVKSAIQEELNGKLLVTGRLEDEILTMSTFIGERNHLIEDLQGGIAKLEEERDHLSTEVHVLKEKLDMAQALAEENEAIATEARQIAEVRKVYVEEKEEEVKLLERSVEELECTVFALENKVDIVRAEAEKHRLQREEIEIELHTMRDQLSQKNIQVLQKEIAKRDTEILQFKAHISELNMHAEAQAREYKQKFMELEAMAQQVNADPASSNSASLTSTKSDKGAAKPRGSSSPFKCIGLGLVQQMNSEKDEELTAARRKIEELESLAASRQKEIFMLNTRLAQAESMTHDVIRDLLGVKLDMTSLLDEPETPKVETDRVHKNESRKKDQEAIKLRKELNEFIQERQSWLHEIKLRHTEMVDARMMAEKLRQREQFISTENEMLKVENTKYKKRIVDLEDELKKFSDHQNLQHRIHHHAKIKEENTLLKIENEDLNVRLRRSEEVLLRVKEELARYRLSFGKDPCIDFDKEEQLRMKLQESEEERIHLAQKLLNLCTCILKVAGLTDPTTNISPSAAEDAAYRLKDRINSLENEIEDLKLKCKLLHENIRLYEIRQQLSPQQPKTNDNFLSS
ncbi:unnamed protein product [Musa textilis]